LLGRIETEAPIFNNEQQSFSLTVINQHFLLLEGLMTPRELEQEACMQQRKYSVVTISAWLFPIGCNHSIHYDSVQARTEYTKYSIVGRPRKSGIFTNDIPMKLLKTQLICRFIKHFFKFLNDHINQ
jgi:hypothetical protein